MTLLRHHCIILQVVVRYITLTMKSLVVYSVKQHQFGRTGRAVVQLGNDSRRCSTSDIIT